MLLGDVTSLLVGDVVVERVYLGNNLLWSSEPVIHEPIAFTVEGTTFEPVLELASGSSATVEWLDDTDTVIATGITPSMTFGDATARVIRCVVDVPEDVVSLNLGFQYEQDEGIYNLGSGYNYVTQPVTGIENLNYFTGLVNFMAARTDGTNEPGTNYTGPVLTGHLDFTGMSNLEHIECCYADVESVTLTGCTSLIRLCLEQNMITELDLNPVRNTLRDLRGAYQRGGALTLAPLDGPLAELYHFCVRRQTLTNMPAMTDLPKVRQLWVWRCGITMDTMTVRSTDNIHSVLLSSGETEGPNNDIRVLDLEDTDWGALSGAIRLRADEIGLEDIIMTGMTPIGEIRLLGNEFDQETLDHITTTVDSWGTSGGLLRIHNNPGRVSESGYDAVQNLLARGWTVDWNAPVAPTVTTTSLGTLAVDVPYSLTLAATGTETITWAVTAGALPDGLTLASDGVLSGTPTTVAAYDFTVTATNFMGSDDQQYTGTVQAELEPTLWADEFDRADASGFANVGNGWFAPAAQTDTDVAIVSGAIVLSGPAAYRHFLNFTDTTLPADLEVEIGFTIDATSEPGAWWGVASHVNPSTLSGRRALFRADKATLRIGNANSTSDGTDISVSALVPTWNDIGQHTLRIRSVGTTTQVYCDGVLVGSRTFSVSGGGSAVGFIGEPQGRAWDYIRVYAAE